MEKTLTAHQCVYAPWLGLFDKIARADLFCLLDTVQFERHSWENRNLIKTQNGPLMLTVPVAMQEHFKKTGGEITIIQNGWARKHLRSIELAYAKAPYFDMYYPALEVILGQDYELLSQLNTTLLHFGLDSFAIKTPVVVASDYDFRGHKSELVLNMCRKLGASHYIFGELGDDYADRQAFDLAGITMECQHYRHPVYHQLHGDFVPNLSFIDLLFNEGPRSREILLGDGPAL